VAGQLTRRKNPQAGSCKQADFPVARPPVRAGLQSTSRGGIFRAASANLGTHDPEPTTNHKGTIMKTSAILLGLSMVLGTTVALADFDEFKDYTRSESVLDVTTIKVKSNMDDAYLEGLKRTWVDSMEVQKKLGYIEDYHIYVSDLPSSGNFNMMLVIKFKNDSMFTPNKARYDAFMKEWGAERNKKTTEIAQRDYPAMREITGEYHMREVTMK
jgi:hypothetical protein